MRDDVTELFHGSIIDHYDSINENGLHPRVGPFVADIHGEAEPLIFACGSDTLDKAEFAMRYHISKKLDTYWTLVTLDQIAEHGLMLVLPAAAFTQNLEYEWIKGVPKAVERFDWYSRSPVRPLRMVTGEAICDLFEEHGGFKVTEEDTEVMKLFPQYADARMINWGDTIKSFRRKAGYDPPRTR